MGLNVVQKLIALQTTLESPETAPGALVPLRINQILAEDATVPEILTELTQREITKTACDITAFYASRGLFPCEPAVAETYQLLRQGAIRLGAFLSRPGNGTSHALHLDRLAVPGRTVLGTTDHTSNLGALAMLALCAGSQSIAAAIAGEPHLWVVPQVVRVVLHGRPHPFVSPHDIGLEIVRRRGLSGLTGMAVELDGQGLKQLGVYARIALAQTIRPLDAVATVFPSDDKTRTFLQRQRRSKSWRRIEADHDAAYAETETIDLGALEPLALRLAAADATVRPVREFQDYPLQAVLVGLEGAATLRDLLAFTALMKGKKVAPDCVAAVQPSTRQALEILARHGEGAALGDLISAGVRLFECGGAGEHACLGAQGTAGVACTDAPSTTSSPPSPLFLVSPETAAASASKGALCDPRRLRRPPKIKIPSQLPIDDWMLVKPGRETEPLADA